MTVKNLIFAFLILLPSITFAASEDEFWSFSFQIGTHAPKLNNLNKLLKAGSYGIEANNANQSNNENINSQVNFFVASPLPESNPGTKSTLSFLWHANDRHSIVFSLGTWETTVEGSSQIQLPIQVNDVRDVLYERRAKFSYTELSTGWRYEAIRFKKFTFYSRLMLHEIFDIDYRDDSIFNVTASNVAVGIEGEEFRRIVVHKSQSASLLAGEIGGGIEWAVNQWFGISFEVAYILSQARVQLRNGVVFGDGTVDVINRFPFRNMNDGTVGYLKDPSNFNGEIAYQTVNIDLSGWQMLLGFTVRY